MITELLEDMVARQVVSHNNIWLLNNVEITQINNPNYIYNQNWLNLNIINDKYYEEIDQSNDMEKNIIMDTNWITPHRELID